MMIIVQYYRFIYTLECRYSTVKHSMILHIVRQMTEAKLALEVYSQKTPHTSPSWISYGVSFVRIGVKTG